MKKLCFTIKRYKILLFVISLLFIDEWCHLNILTCIKFFKEMKCIHFIFIYFYIFILIKLFVLDKFENSRSLAASALYENSCCLNYIREKKCCSIICSLFRCELFCNIMEYLKCWNVGYCLLRMVPRGPGDR